MSLNILSSRNLFITSVLLLFAFIPYAYYSYKKGETEIIPNEDPAFFQQLDQALIRSSYDADGVIAELSSITTFPKYTNYKKNYALARLFEKKKDYKNAIKIYGNLLEYNYPLKERVLFHYAFLSVKLGNDQTALKYYNKLIHDFPKSRSIPQAKYYLAQAYLRLKLKTQALNIFQGLKYEFPKTQYGIASNFYLGEHSYYKNNLGNALRLWKVYLAQSPDGRFAKEIVALIEKKKGSIVLKPEDYSLLGDVFFHNKEYKKAASYYLQGKRRNYQLGYSLFRSGQKKEAIGFLKRYAKSNPKEIKARYALYYGALCTPSYLRKGYWKDVAGEIKDLEYYALYKQARLEGSSTKRERLLKDLITSHPKGDFTLDAVWDIMWNHIKLSDYNSAFSIGEKYFNLIENTSNTRAKIGFWLGKIAEKQNNKKAAKHFYNKVKALSIQDYYSHRSSSRLEVLELNGKDKKWSQVSNSEKYKEFTWSIPRLIGFDQLKNLYGATITELVRLRQFDEVISLIGSSDDSSKQINSWLKALNEEYLKSINLAAEVIKANDTQIDKPLYKLAYPLYYFYYIIENSVKYSGLDPFLVASIIRQESRFDKGAVSVSNAKGLMQFIPSTGRSVARQQNIRLSSLEDLHKPEVGINLGCRYINDLIADLGNPMLAVASYNAGPNAIKRWLRKAKNTDLDYFVEDIPYDQTRDYVKHVFSNYWTYHVIYD